MSDIDPNSMLIDDERLVKQTCKYCNGTGKLSVTKRMIIDAGIYDMDEWEETCPYCFGDCYTIEHEREDDPR